MGATSGRSSASVVERLRARPTRFGFFQAVRILERAAARAEPAPARARRTFVGSDDPAAEAVRFRVTPSLGFPAHAIDRIRRREGQTHDEVTITFTGLTGPAGVLPDHYTELVLRRSRRRDNGLRDFLDLFNHRLVAFFYRAWVKYRPPVAYERAQMRGDTDAFSSAVRALVGLAAPSLSDRLGLSDESFMYYAGHLSRAPRSAAVIEQLVAERFGLPARLDQFAGEWRYLPENDRTRLPSARRPDGSYAVLGRDAMLGERCWDVTGRVRLWLGPMPYAAYRELLPGGDQAHALGDFTKMVLGPSLGAEVQLVLSQDDVPPLRLAGHATGDAPAEGEMPDDPDARRLGWDTWLAASSGETVLLGATLNVDDERAAVA